MQLDLPMVSISIWIYQSSCWCRCTFIKPLKVQVTCLSLLKKDLVFQHLRSLPKAQENAKNIAMDWCKRCWCSPCWFALKQLTKKKTEESQNKLSFVVVWSPLSKQVLKLDSQVMPWIGLLEVLSWNEIDVDDLRGGFKKMHNHFKYVEYGDYVSGPTCNYWASQRETWRLF